MVVLQSLKWPEAGLFFGLGSPSPRPSLPRTFRTISIEPHMGGREVGCYCVGCWIVCCLPLFAKASQVKRLD